MGSQEKMEREISLIELFWKILLGWRQVICGGVIVAVLIGGMKYALDTRAYQMAQNADPQREIELSVEEQEQLEDAKMMMERIEKYENYLDESALMQIDPYEKPVVELQYYVESEYIYNYTKDNQKDYTDNLMSLYSNYVRSGEMSKKLLDKIGLHISQANLSELCSVSQSGSTMVVTFIWKEEQKLGEISDFIKGQLAQKEKEFQEVGPHKLKLLRESQNTIADVGLAEAKNVYLNNIATIDSQLTNLKLSMSENQLNLLYKDADIENGIDKTELSKPAFSKKFLLLGFFIGIFCVCVGIVLNAFVTTRLQDAEEIRTLYNTRLLGEIKIKSKKKIALSVIDERIIAIKNRRKKKLTVEQQIKMIVTNISLACKQQGIKEVFMTGSEYENADSETLDMLKQGLADQNIQVKEGENIFYDAESLKRGTEIGNVLFIEQIGKSIYDEISNELDLAKEQKSRILGVVVLVA